MAIYLGALPLAYIYLGGSVQIREAEAGDVQEVRTLLEAFHGQTPDESSVTSQFNTILQDKNRTVLLILGEDQTIGMAIVNLIFKLPKVEARIDEVFVMQGKQGQGYGRKLMEACEQWAWSHGADSIELTSRPVREAANALYQKLGYQLRETNVYNKKKEV